MPKSRASSKLSAKVYGSGNININTESDDIGIHRKETSPNYDRTCLEKKELDTQKYKKNRVKFFDPFIFLKKNISDVLILLLNRIVWSWHHYYVLHLWALRLLVKIFFLSVEIN